MKMSDANQSKNKARTWRRIVCAECANMWGKPVTRVSNQIREVFYQHVHTTRTLKVQEDCVHAAPSIVRNAQRGI
jgi:hypothetical protein